MEEDTKKKVTSHAWKGTWNRPMKISENGLDPFTIARMTDHNVRGSDDDDTEAERDEDRDDDLNDPSAPDQAA